MRELISTISIKPSTKEKLERLKRRIKSKTYDRLLNELIKTMNKSIYHK